MIADPSACYGPKHRARVETDSAKRNRPRHRPLPARRRQITIERRNHERRERIHQYADDEEDQVFCQRHRQRGKYTHDPRRDDHLLAPPPIGEMP